VIDSHTGEKSPHDRHFEACGIESPILTRAPTVSENSRGSAVHPGGLALWHVVGRPTMASSASRDLTRDPGGLTKYQWELRTSNYQWQQTITSFQFITEYLACPLLNPLSINLSLANFPWYWHKPSSSPSKFRSLFGRW